MKLCRPGAVGVEEPVGDTSVAINDNTQGSSVYCR